MKVYTIDQRGERASFMNRKFFLFILISIIIIIFVVFFTLITMSVDSTKLKDRSKVAPDKGIQVERNDILKKDVISVRNKFDVFKPEPKKAVREREYEWSGLEFEDNKEEVFLR